MKSKSGISWYNTAVELYKKDHLTESKKLLIEIHKSNTSFIPAIDLLAIIEFKLKNFQQALKWTEILQNTSPDNPDYLNRKFILLLNLKAIKEYLLLAWEVLNKDQSHPGLVYTSIKAFVLSGRYENAENLLSRIPKDHELYKRGSEFIKTYYRDLQVLNNSLREGVRTRNWKEALATYETWLQNHSPSADTYYNLGLIYLNSGVYVHAIAAFESCIEFDPEYNAAAILYLWYAKIMICDWSEYDKARLQIMNTIDHYLQLDNPNYEIPIYILSFFDIPQNYFANFGTKYYNKLIRDKSQNNPSIQSSDWKIRIGYISSRFYSHPIGKIYKDLFRSHDRNRFDVFIYSTQAANDSISKEIEAGADFFRIISHNTIEAYQQIKTDMLDILVTVGGHGDDMPMDIIAIKPAKVVVNMHGYNESLGGKFADFLISDKEVIDDSNSDKYVEKIILQKGCSIPVPELVQPIINSRSHYGIPEHAFVFLSAAHPRKITPEIFRIWEQLLIENENSVLWILDYGIKEVKENLLVNLSDSKVKSRIIFSGLVSYPEHLGRYHLADLLLDTPLYNCHSVGMEALISGLPFITLKGSNANSRFGASMLSAVGLNDLIGPTEEEYFQKARLLSYSKKEMNKYRDILMRNSQDMKPENFVIKLEECYAEILRKV